MGHNLIVFCYLKEEGIDMDDMDSDGMEEDEEALLEAMDAEDAAAAELENNEGLTEGETVKTEGKI